MQISSTPAYPLRHDGVAIVVGSGRDAVAELAETIALLVRTPVVMACENMFRLVETNMICSAHDGFFASPELLGRREIKHMGVSDVGRPVTLGATYVWRGLKGGTSSLFGARLARHLGFSPVLLVGCPLDASGHAAGTSADPTSPFTTGSAAGIAHYRAAWIDAHNKGELEGVFSIGGWTREILGWPAAQLQ